MPLTYADQMVLVEAFASVIVPAVGPVQPTSYRWGRLWPSWQKVDRMFYYQALHTVQV